MPIFDIAVSWRCSGVVEVEAPTFDEAIDRAWKDATIPLPAGEYVDESLIVDEDMSAHLSCED